MFVSNCFGKELHASLSMELYGNLTRTLVQDFLSMGLTVIFDFTFHNVLIWVKKLNRYVQSPTNLQELHFFSKVLCQISDVPLFSCKVKVKVLAEDAT